VVPFVCSIAMELNAINTVMLTARAYYSMLPTTHWISLISSGESLGEMSTGRGACALAPYCLGAGEYGQFCGRIGMRCLYFRRSFSKSSRDVIPFQFIAAVQIARPVHCDAIFFFDAVDEVSGMFFSDIFHPKIIDD